MSLKYRPFAAIGFTVLFSLFCFIYFSDYFVPVFMGFGVLFLIISFCFKSLRERLVPIYIAGSLIFSGLIYTVASDSNKSAQKYIGETAHISGIVAEEPEYNGKRYHYVLELDEINSEKIDCRLNLSLAEDIGAEISDVVSLDATIYEIASESREVQIYYHSKRIFIGAYNYNSDDCNVKVENSDKLILKKQINNIKNIIVRNVKNNICGENGETVVAMLLGDKSGLSNKRIESFREAGIAPIFAVSGLHLSIWVLGLYSFLKSIGVRKSLNSIISVAFTVFFMLLTGLTPSVCRAGIMMILLLGGNIFYRKADSVNSLGFVAFLLCSTQPYIATDTGFLLSFAATLGIVTIVPACDKHVFSKLGDNFFARSVRNLLIPVLVSVSASVAVLPITILFIGKVSLFSLVSNLLLNYVATMCMVTGGVAAVIEPIPYLSDSLFAISDFLSGLMLKFVDLICSAPLTMVSTANIFWQIGALVSVAVVVLAVFNFKGKNIFRFACIGLVADILIFSLLSHFYYRDLTQVRILNVEYGVTAVVCRNGEKILLSGKSEEYRKNIRVGETLEYFNQRNPEMFLIADKNGLEDVANYSLIKNYDFNRIVSPYSDQSLESVADLSTIYAEPKAEIEVFDDDTIHYETCESYSIALADFNGIKLLFLFDSFKKAVIPQEYLEADILICEGFIPYCINPADYKNVIVCCEGKTADSIIEYVESCGGYALSYESLESVIVNIRNESYKIIASEG